MFSQIVTLSVDPARKDDALRIIEEWSSGPGMRLSGCDQVQTHLDNADQGKITVIVEFSDKRALDDFSADLETLEHFERIKPLVAGSIDVVESSVVKKSLI